MRIPMILVSVVFLGTGCRLSQRPNVTADDPITVAVRMNGIDAATIDQYKLSAQMKLCADTTGTATIGTSYNFAVKGVKKDTVCQIRLVGAKGSDAGVSFFDGSEDGVYFDSTSVTIKEDITGGLSADAFLQKHFATKITAPSTTFRVDASVHAEIELVSTCTCRIHCTPALVNDASLVRVAATRKDATCSFDNVAVATASECTEMVVQCGDKVYAGKWPAALKIDTSAGKSTTLPVVNILAATPTADGSVIVNPEISKTGGPQK